MNCKIQNGIKQLKQGYNWRVDRVEQQKQPKFVLMAYLATFRTKF